MLSVVPLIMIVLMVGGSILSSGDTTRHFLDFIRRITSDQVYHIFRILINSISIPKLSFGSFISFMILIYTSTLALEDLRISLDEIWKSEHGENEKFIHLLLHRSKTLLTTFLCGFFIVVLSLTAPILRMIQKYTELLTNHMVSFQVYDLVLTLFISTIIFMYFNSFLPKRKIPFRLTFRGSFISALLFLGGKKMLILYLNSHLLTKSFGPGGHLLLVFLWFYYSTMIFFIGTLIIRSREIFYEKAEINQ
jgi:membrane protein